ncbi:MAG: LUD domain-containing protein, partial [Clostridia bacterium]
TNKIVDNLDCAIDRIRNYVAPLNGKRLGRKTPCVLTGKCSLCNSPDCMCNTTVISHHPTKLQQNVYIIIVDQQLGY